MSDDKTEQLGRHQKWLKGPQGMEAIPVDLVVFSKVLDLPGIPSKDRYKDLGAQTNQRRVRMWFVPWMRAVMLVGYEPSEFQPTGQPMFVSEGMCAWVPKA